MLSQEQIPQGGLLDLVKRGYSTARKNNDDMMTAFYMLCKEAEQSEDVFTSLARFVCSTHFAELRWHLFCKNMAENETSPTLGAQRQHIIRVHPYMRDQAFISHQTFLDPLDDMKFLMHLRLYGIAA